MLASFGLLHGILSIPHQVLPRRHPGRYLYLLRPSSFFAIRRHFDYATASRPCGSATSFVSCWLFLVVLRYSIDRLAEKEVLYENLFHGCRVMKVAMPRACLRFNLKLKLPSSLQMTSISMPRESSTSQHHTLHNYIKTARYSKASVAETVYKRVFLQLIPFILSFPSASSSWQHHNRPSSLKTATPPPYRHGTSN